MCSAHWAQMHLPTERCYFTHPLIQIWNQERDILGENLAQLSSVEPFVLPRKGLFYVNI